MAWAVACALQVVKMSLFNTFSSKSVRLEEFEQVQFAATDSVANHLRDNWTASIKSIIKYVGAGALSVCQLRHPFATLPGRCYCALLQARWLQYPANIATYYVIVS
jgi:hypothetical protein